MSTVVAHQLDEAVGAPCLLVEYIGIAHGELAGVYTNYVRMPEGQRLAETPFHGHWYALLADAGLSIGSTELLIEAMSADEVVADRIAVPVGSPLLAIQQLIRDDEGRPFNFAILRHRGDRLALRSEARRPVVREVER
jgi:GntR family transcriptional regulator